MGDLIKKQVPLICLVIIVIVFWGLIKYALIMADSKPFGDYNAHIKYASSVYETGKVTTAYFLYQLVTVAIAFSLKISIRFAAYITDLFSILFTSIILYFYYISNCHWDGNAIKRWLSVLFVVVTLLFAPIAFSGWLSEAPISSSTRHMAFYKGYFHSANIYHNPTLLLLKPFALLLFWKVSNYLGQTNPHRFSKSTLYSGVVLSSLVVLNALAKPSYLICYLPALIIILFYLNVLNRKNNDQYQKNVEFKKLKFICYFAIFPTIGILITQYLLQFIRIIDLGNSNKTDIVFAPFAVISRLLSPQDIIVNFLFSLAFMLFILIIWRKRFLNNAGSNLAVLGAFFGFSWAFLFAEYYGERIGMDGNFFWSTQITLFILLVAILSFVLNKLTTYSKLSKKDKIYTWISVLILSVHLFSGGYWYYCMGKYSGLF